MRVTSLVFDESSLSQIDGVYDRQAGPRRKKLFCRLFIRTSLDSCHELRRGKIVLQAYATH